jgi:hypothetical protein
MLIVFNTSASRWLFASIEILLSSRFCEEALMVIRQNNTAGKVPGSFIMAVNSGCNLA